MRGFRWVPVALFLVFFAGVAWACGDGEEEEEAPPAATSPAGEAPDAREDTEAPEVSEGGGEFGDLTRKFGGVAFKATYEISGLDEMGGGTMTWYKKGDNMRIDIESEVEGEEMSAIIITRPDQSYFCTQIPELGEGTCLETPGEAGEGVGEFVGDLEDILADPEAEVVSTSGRKIAGEDADCFTVRMLALDEETEVCLTDDGVPLSIKTTAGGVEMSFEATDFSHDVSDDDFEPPYPISEGFPGLPDIDIEFDE